MKENSGLQLVVLSVLRMDWGPKFTSGVSPLQINNMLGEQITAGEFTNKECTVMHIHDDYYDIHAGITKKYIDRYPTASMTNNLPPGCHTDNPQV